MMAVTRAEKALAIRALNAALGNDSNRIPDQFEKIADRLDKGGMMLFPPSLQSMLHEQEGNPLYCED